MSEASSSVNTLEVANSIYLLYAWLVLGTQGLLLLLIGFVVIYGKAQSKDFFETQLTFVYKLGISLYPWFTWLMSTYVTPSLQKYGAMIQNYPTR